LILLTVRRIEFKFTVRRIEFKFRDDYSRFPHEFITKEKLNSVASVRERTIPTEPPPLVGEVSVNLLWIEAVTWSARFIPTAVFSVF
jgi:hypothetical protein